LRLFTSKKIYRAFPELDPYDDQVCELYIRRARRLRSSWKGLLSILISIPISILIWSGVTWAMASLLETYKEQWESPSVNVLAVTVIFFLTGFVWVPVMIAFIVRDMCLNRCIRTQLSKVVCDECEYALIGLDVFELGGSRVVQCPECGAHTQLNAGHITEADIDPTLIVKN